MIVGLYGTPRNQVRSGVPDHATILAPSHGRPGNDDEFLGSS
jgi:hypothetical protein